MITAATRPGQWEAWLDAVGVDHQIMEGGHRFDHLFVAMHAVRDGLGSIIAPKNLFDASFAKQELVAPLPNLTLKGVPYFIHRTARAEGKHVGQFTDWLHRAVARSNSRPSDDGVAGTDGPPLRSTFRRQRLAGALDVDSLKPLDQIPGRGGDRRRGH